MEKHVSLLDLSKQLPFKIDDELKKELCFAETLIVSCGHYAGVFGETSSDSNLTCSSTTDKQVITEETKEEFFEIRDKVEEEVAVEEDSEIDDDFQFFFFPDCNKPEPIKTSKDSLIIVDGLPKLNPAAPKYRKYCTCDLDKKGKCECHTKLPCKCGAKETAHCLCSKLEEICICKKDGPTVVCECKSDDVCVCYPNELPRAECVCENVDKPCVCYPTKFASPVCVCGSKPKFGFNVIKPVDEEQSGAADELKNEEVDLECNEMEYECVSEYKSEVEEEHDPCVCQEAKPKLICFCQKGEECTCRQAACVCGVQHSCVCEPINDQDVIPCQNDDTKSVCSCPTVNKECTCDADSPEGCTCFPKKECECGHPADCKCNQCCVCTNPCICDTGPKKDEVCPCSDKPDHPVADLTCICPKKQISNKLKRTRATKHGYRWCHEIDPRHTFFDYGYDRHDKISYKAQMREKFKVLGLYDEVKGEEEVDEECPVHPKKIKAPPYEHKVKRASLDCCSAVGGINISVEFLGEDNDKFLVQVASHSSKEGAKTASRLVSILDCNLHTMEENRNENILNNYVTKERRSYIAICDSGYYNKVTKICGERSVVKRFYHSFDDAKNFLLEGGNLMFLRYLGLRRYRGNIKTETLMINGAVCESIYVCHGVSQAIVNNKPLFVVKVERHIIEPSGYIHQTLTVLTLRGYTVSHEWADSTYIMHINPLLNIVPEKDLIEEHAPLREKWREDLQLLSDYLDFKSLRTSEGGQYLNESGELTSTIRDYLQALLLIRPHDAIHFTRHYFDSVLSSLDLPHDEHFDPCSKHVRYYFFEE